LNKIVAVKVVIAPTVETTEVVTAIVVETVVVIAVEGRINKEN
jgi:hypothetical protein